MQLTNAGNVAQTQAEILQDIDFTAAQVTDGSQVNDLLESTPGSNTYTGTPQTFQNVTYTPSWTVLQVNGNPNLLRVTMTVSWAEKGAQKTYRMNFYTGIN
jgi:hypothetical protein